MADWNGFKKNGTTYIPNDATARAGVIANTKLIKDTVGWSGKNRFKVDASSKTDHDVAYTVNNNGSVKVNGTGSGDGGIVLSTVGMSNIPAGNYIASTGTSAQEGVFVRFYATRNGQTVTLADVNGTEQPITIQDGDVVNAYLTVGNGKTVSNKMFYPMIRSADILDSTFEPYFGSTAFPRSEQAVLGAKNFALPDVLHFALAGSVGNSVFVANNDVIGFCAKIEKNTDYTWDYAVGDRYRLALSANYPVNNGACYIEYVNDTGVKTHTFNSGNYEYAYLYCYNNNDKTYDEIKPLCTLASDTDRTFARHAMTNKELTDALTYKKGDSINLAGCMMFGYITNGKKAVWLTLPLARNNSGTPNFNISSFAVRGDNEYVVAAGSPLSNYTIEQKYNTAIGVVLSFKNTDDSAFNVTNNNTPVVAYIETGTLTLS